MLNQIILVGRLTSDIEVKEAENGSSYANMTLAVPRSFKNADGQYDTDFINCKVWDNIASNTSEYCHKGDIVGVKGRLQSRDNSLEVVAEKVSFLSKQKDINDKGEKMEHDELDK